jgi:hypothetical protein
MVDKNALTGQWIERRLDLNGSFDLTGSNSLIFEGRSVLIFAYEVIEVETT